MLSTIIKWPAFFPLLRKKWKICVKSQINVSPFLIVDKVEEKLWNCDLLLFIRELQLRTAFGAGEQGLSWDSAKWLSLCFNALTWFDLLPTPSHHLSQRRAIGSVVWKDRPNRRQESGQYGSLSLWTGGQDNCRRWEDPHSAHLSIWGGLCLSPGTHNSSHGQISLGCLLCCWWCWYPQQESYRIPSVRGSDKHSTAQ